MSFDDAHPTRAAATKSAHAIRAPAFFDIVRNAIMVPLYREPSPSSTPAETFNRLPMAPFVGLSNERLIVLAPAAMIR
jgi:hypothetical protein